MSNPKQAHHHGTQTIPLPFYRGRNLQLGVAQNRQPPPPDLVVHYDRDSRIVVQHAALTRSVRRGAGVEMN